MTSPTRSTGILGPWTSTESTWGGRPHRGEPGGGVFTAEPGLSAMVEVGTTLGHVRSGCDLVAVRTPFRGALQLAAHDGERLGLHQRVAWLQGC